MELDNGGRWSGGQRLVRKQGVASEKLDTSQVEVLFAVYEFGEVAEK